MVMPKGPKGEKRPSDLNQWAKRMVDVATMDEEERADKKLTQIAENSINIDAAQGGEDLVQTRRRVGGDGSGRALLIRAVFGHVFDLGRSLCRSP